MANQKDLANGLIGTALTSVATTLVLQAGYGDSMPAVPFFLTITPAGQLSTMGNSEIVRVTARTGDTLTIERAQKGTTYRAFSIGDIVSNSIYADGSFDSLDVNGDIYSNGKNLVDMFYPVGSTYFNKTNSTNPATRLGFGSWARLEGVVLGGRSETTGSPFNVTAGTVIGADTHTLTVAQMPSHGHDVRTRHSSGSFGWEAGITRSNGGSMENKIPSEYMFNTGGGQAHNNIQRTLVGYLWERTA